MKKNNLILIGIIALVVLLSVIWVVVSYNSLVSLDETVKEKWAYVLTAYQRRADLIPNLVATVQKYTNYEGELLTAVTEARASVGRASSPGQLASAGTEMNSAISRLLVVMENYPVLKASEQFITLQDELSGTENRIKAERDIFNTAVKEMNIKVRSFPSNMVAGMFGFGLKEGFESEIGAEKALDVKELFTE
ncbi:LemA family protein [Candidatus Woesearchaeota archaeon]|nr:LemA family protein [Candidatus Woesearchaeota archaeon]